jgi:hypothetical protein
MTSRRKLHTEHPQISDVTVKEFGHSKSVLRWLKEPQGYILRGLRNEELFLRGLRNDELF